MARDWFIFFVGGTEVDAVAELASFKARSHLLSLTEAAEDTLVANDLSSVAVVTASAEDTQ